MSKGQELAIVLYLINVSHSPTDTVLPLVKKIDLIFNSLYFLSMCNGLFLHVNCTKKSTCPSLQYSQSSKESDRTVGSYKHFCRESQLSALGLVYFPLYK